ncbi:MAG: four helix bundle suffix domain-containing protein [Candidatus Roizmanbacteria bacterium]|nr:four helix bundle suffix domain-containing protein [Candidatus Roizmanbacteria bacterium]
MTNKTNMKEEKLENKNKPIAPHGGYRRLISFQMATLVYDLTVEFVERYVEKKSRTRDQMVQAARSGRQNIAEGSQASGTSKKTEIKLTSVARASLEELLLDYEDYLRQHKLFLWPQNNPEIQAIKKLSRSSNKSYLSYRSYLTRAEPASNMLITLIHQANYLLDKQLLSLEHSFIQHGGFTERLYTARVKNRT